MRKTIIAVFVFLSMGSTVFGQDPYFSQYFMSPSTLNPALIGKGISNARVMSVYRSQWWGSSPSAFTTYTASAEMRLFKKNSDTSQFSLGITAMSDASNAGLLKNNYFSAGLCYDQPLDNESKSQLSMGFTIGYGNRMIDRTKTLFQDQFGSLGFSTIVPSNDAVSLARRNYFDISTGVQYSYNSKKWGINAGAGVFHIAQPNEFVYSNNENTLKLRYTCNASVVKKYQGGDELYFMGAFTNHGINNILTLGTMYKFKFADQHMLDRFNVGAFNRFNDAYIGYLGVEQKSWSMGFSYDIINSDVQTFYNSVQSMEFSLGWLIPSKKRQVKTVDRFTIY